MQDIETLLALPDAKDVARVVDSNEFDPAGTNRFGASPLMLLMHCPFRSVDIRRIGKKMLMKGVPTDTKDRDGFGLAHYAAMKGSDRLRFCQDMDIDLREKSRVDMIPLHMAAMTGCFDSIDFLLELDPAMAAATDKLGKTPFDIAQKWDMIGKKTEEEGKTRKYASAEEYGRSLKRLSEALQKLMLVPPERP